jgi:hypothetical protein
VAQVSHNLGLKAAMRRARMTRSATQMKQGTQKNMSYSPWKMETWLFLLDTVGREEGVDLREHCDEEDN